MTYPPGLKEKLVQMKRRLAEHIEQAFADVPYPGDNRIVRGIDLDHVYDDVSEEGKIVVAFRGKHWKAVSQDVLFQEQSSLSFFTLEAYHFYLPVYLLTYLRRLTPEFLDTTGAGNVLSSLEHSLRPATDWTALKDFVHQRLALLTPDQKSVVREFLHWLYRNELRKGIRLSDSDLSLFAYWGFPEGAPGLLTHRRWYQAAAAGDGESEIGDPLPSVISGAMISQDGKWIVDGRSCELIQRLIGRRFIHVDQREDGWTKLYQDPVDDAYWELSYPHSEMHGGGPPALTKLSTGQVRTLYALPALDRR